MQNYFRNLLIAVAQLANTVLFGEPDETFSARCFRTKSMLRYVIDALFFWQYDNALGGHCRQCYLWELEIMDLPKDYRTQGDVR